MVPPRPSSPETSLPPGHEPLHNGAKHYSVETPHKAVPDHSVPTTQPDHETHDPHKDDHDDTSSHHSAHRGSLHTA